MDLIVFGLNHQTAPVDVRERWALSSDESRDALDGLRDAAVGSEHLILSTCNRTEFYSHFPGSCPAHSSGCAEAATPAGAVAAAPGPDAVPGTLDFYRKIYLSGLGTAGRDPAEGLDSTHFYVHRQAGAIEHLFRLASGLDSMILGESQILKQIKDAFALARDAQTAGKLFNRLFPAALRTGKRVRSLTSLSTGCITPGQAALGLARAVHQSLADRTLVVVGSGKIATSAAQAFGDADLKGFLVVNRTPARARELVEKLGAGTTVAWERIRETLVQADVVVSSTGAVEPIVTRAALAAIQRERGHRPLVIVDLAVPRDFEPTCASIEGVYLYNIDDLNNVIQENVAARHAHVPAAEEIVKDELRQFQGWMTYLQVDPVLRHLIERFEQIRLGELQAYISQFPPELHTLVDQLTNSLVKKMLHFPIEKLKSLRDQDSGLNDNEVTFLHRLFLSRP